MSPTGKNGPSSPPRDKAFNDGNTWRRVRSLRCYFENRDDERKWHSRESAINVTQDPGKMEESGGVGSDDSQDNQGRFILFSVEYVVFCASLLTCGEGEWCWYVHNSPYAFDNVCRDRYARASCSVHFLIWRWSFRCFFSDAVPRWLSFCCVWTDCCPDMGEILARRSPFDA